MNGRPSFFCITQADKRFEVIQLAEFEADRLVIKRKRVRSPIGDA